MIESAKSAHHGQSYASSVALGRSWCTAGIFLHCAIFDLLMFSNHSNSGRRLWVILGLASVVAVALAVSAGAGSSLPNLMGFPDASGVMRTYSTANGIDLSNPFFASLGTNGRSCSTCHQLRDAMSVSAAHIRERFEASAGLDPIFRTVDGSNCPSADVSTLDARRLAYSQLLNKGLIRVGMAMPTNAEFSLVGIDDPYNCASAGNLSLYRRPLPATNLRYLTTVMWDGRESVIGNTLAQNLSNQIADATMGHAQAIAAPSAAQTQAILDFEMALSSAQAQDNGAGTLNDRGAQGGPRALSQQAFYLGVNDSLGGDPQGHAFNAKIFNLFDAWESAGYHGEQHRAAVARGQELFNSFPIAITGVRGLNDKLGIATISGTCGTCHDTPNVGNHSFPLPIDIGIAAADRRTLDMPLYTFRCNATGETFQVTDPGRALVTGKCSDIAKFKGPILRGLAARAPYFHNGSAATLSDALDFYQTRFNLALTPQQKADLVAFLNSL